MHKIITAYFSATGVTAKLAERIAAFADSDIYEIIPETAYTRADLNWMDPKSRSSVEMNNKSSRPAISGSVDNMDEYDTILLGFPIWWYMAPTIINTFLEKYELSGKRIIPFATSGSSGMGETLKYLAPSCIGARLEAGKRFSARASDTEIKAWLDSLNV